DDDFLGPWPVGERPQEGPKMTYVVIHVGFVDHIFQHLALRGPAIKDHWTVEASHSRNLSGVLRCRLECFAIAMDVKKDASVPAIGLVLERSPPVAFVLESHWGAKFFLFRPRLAWLCDAAVTQGVAAMAGKGDRGRAAIGQPAGHKEKRECC